MSGNVVSLYGGTVPETGMANETLVEELERLLEAARSGEIVGMVGAYHHKDKGNSYSFAGMVACYGLIGGLECAKARLLQLAAR
jgi:hypothetical protein